MANSYSVLIGNKTLNLLPNRIKNLCPKAKKIALLSDRNVPNKFKKFLKDKLNKYELVVLNFNASEKSKSMKTVNLFVEKLLRLNFNRSDLIVGIGGGIFLSPILFLIKAAKPKHIVTAASLFIFINSISGVIGQLTKNIVLSDISNYWYLFLVVIIGGHIGNYLNLKIFPTRLLALITSVLVLFVAIRIGIKLFL